MILNNYFGDVPNTNSLNKHTLTSKKRTEGERDGISFVNEYSIQYFNFLQLLPRKKGGGESIYSISHVPIRQH